MAWTQAQLDALEAAIAEGTLSVQYGDKKVTYRSMDEMLRVRDLMRKELGKTAGSGARVSMKFDKGL